MSRGMQACLHNIRLSKAMGIWVNSCRTANSMLSMASYDLRKAIGLEQGILGDSELCQRRVFCLIKVCMLQVQHA